MKVVVYGATGKAGNRILAELLRRGHAVVAVSRHPESLAGRPGITPVADDLSNVDKIASIIRGSDAVVSAYAPPVEDTDQLIGATDHLVQAIAKNGGPRLIVVGGAGSLFVAPGVTLLDSGHLPAEWIPIVKSHAAVLNNLRRSSIDWTYFSPAAFFEPGERTGKFRLGKDDLISDDNGVSRISMEDYAIALVDELEQPQHAGGQRFTIGY
ncbi:MAG TPA: NAD(P)-dependent oxidoreductase [Acidobacteriaceae bacterium]|nr:NAD(P)-dependent oxidoreductase [Acidobacteriaceae bacterium]